jgi:hypothetical protein
MGAEEIDIGFHNAQRVRGLWWLDKFVLVECKNWSTTVGSAEVGWFLQKLADRGLRDGILIARSGITGDDHHLTAARNLVSGALAFNRRMLVLTWGDIGTLKSGAALARVVEHRLGELVVMRANF